MLEQSTGVIRPQETTTASISIDEPTVEKPEPVPTLINTHEPERPKSNENVPTPFTSLPDLDGVVRACPVCYCEFADDMPVEAKQEHIDQHF